MVSTNEEIPPDQPQESNNDSSDDVNDKNETIEKEQDQANEVNVDGMQLDSYEKCGFDKGHGAAEILGATDSRGYLSFLIKWKGTNHASLVPAKVANVKIRQMVIQFYEKRMSWEAANQLH